MEIKEIHDAQKAYFATGATKDTAMRKAMLKKLKAGLKKWEQALAEALMTDLHKSYEEAYMTEIGLLYAEIGEHLRKLDRWARRKSVKPTVGILPSRTRLVSEPLGNSLIIAPWNYPVLLLLSPLVGAISAGCTAVLKPSPYVPNVSATLDKLIKDCFDERYVAIVQGGREVNTELLAQRWDMIFFTGSPQFGKAVMKAAAENLTPVVLELGGKSPCIVDKSADIEIAARRIVWGKCLNSGQTCIAPDYLFVHKDIKDEFLNAFERQLGRLYKDGTERSPYYVHMVNDEAFERVRSYLKDGRIVRGGRCDSRTRYIEPTIIEGMAPDSPVMNEEIFGPLFPLMCFSDIDEVREYVTSREKPLAFYYFGKESTGWELIANTSSGGACINDTIMHIANGNAPFGGVGNSGMGNYHGRRSFDAFSHERTIIATPTWVDIPVRYMPYRLFGIVKKILK